MSRHVHGVYAPAGDAAYATPEGEILHVPQDFAFADTVVALDEELPVPSQRPPVSQHPHSQPPPSDPSWGGPMSMTRAQPLSQHPPPYAHPSQPPHAYPMQAGGPHELGPQGHDAGLVTSVRGAFQRTKHTIDSSRAEMKELWSATDDRADPTMAVKEDDDPVVRLARRIKTFWSFFEWDRDDVMRATWIGIAVFALAAMIGLFAFGR